MASKRNNRGKQAVPHTLEEPDFLTNAERKKHRIKRERAKREASYTEVKWEERFGGKIFSILAHGFTFQLIDTCNPPITSSEMARCLGLNPEGKSIRRLFDRSGDKNGRGLSRLNALNLLKAAYRAGRLDEYGYLRLKEAISPSGAVILENKRKVTRMIEILSKKLLKLSA